MALGGIVTPHTLTSARVGCGIKFIPNLRAARQHFMCRNGERASCTEGEPGGVWRSTLAYQILFAARQIVARRQITQGEGGGWRGASHPQTAVAVASLAQGTRV